MGDSWRLHGGPCKPMCTCRTLTCTCEFAQAFKVLLQLFPLANARRTMSKPQSKATQSKAASVPPQLAQEKADPSAATSRTTPASQEASSVASSHAAASAPTPLRYLNNTTAKLATWDIAIANAHVEEYSYPWQNTIRKGKAFRCMLVSIHDPSQYCIGEVKKVQNSPPDAIEKAQTMYQNDFKFRLGPVELSMKAKSEYMSPTVKLTVDLQRTTTTKLLTDGTHRQAQPVTTCAECVEFTSMQAFDITALVDTVSEARTVTNNKYVRDVQIIDESFNAVQIICPKISLFYEVGVASPDSRKGEPAYIQQLMEAAGQPIPFHFFGMTAQKTKDGLQLESMRGWYHIIPADTPGDARGLKLTQDHASIMAAKANQTVVVLQKEYVPGEYSKLIQEEGQETFCAHLAELRQRTGLAALDDTTTVWQTNWIFHTIMPGTHLTKAGDKLWLNIMCQDVSGRVEVQMNEKVALEVSGRDTKEEVLQALTDGDAIFPTVMTLKVARTIKVQSQAEHGDEQVYVNINVVAAAAQDTSMPRTTSIMQLVPILRSLTSMPNAILPTALNMLRPSTVYPLQVQYPVPDLNAQPCNRVWILIKATKKSKCTDEFPYTVTTDDVEDVLEGMDNLGVTSPKKQEAIAKYKLVSICNKEARTSLTLTPAHGKHVFALALITSAQQQTLFAETIETVQKDDKDKLSMIMQQEMALAVQLIKQTAKGKAVSWTETISPIAASRCRALGKSPTGPSMDPLEASPAKVPRTE